MTKHIAFQGIAGAYSDIACRTARPDYETLPCFAFYDAALAVREGRADLAMLPIENSVAGRVADVHALLPNAGLHIIGEHYQPVEHHLLAPKGTRLEDITEVHSHVQALSQCKDWLRAHGMRPVVKSDTASAARQVAEQNNGHTGAIASSLAGTLYGLQSLAANIADRPNNTTRFLVLAPTPCVPAPNTQPCVTSLLFRVRSVPAALYKALGGFATNALNITKLESYLVDGAFTAAQFYIDVEGHVDEKHFALALEELRFFAHEITILGTYPAAPFRLKEKH